MKTILFVNDSYFSYLLAKPIIDNYYNNIKLIVFSTRIKKSKSILLSIYKNTYFRYFAFRSFIELLAIINNFFRKNTVLSLAKLYNIPMVITSNVDDLNFNLKGHQIAFVFNFDQILKENIINLFPRGIINLHASKLPFDRGISPALWAFARGDKNIWTTIFEIDSGIDTGRIYNQYSIAVKENESYFSLYKRICFNGGKSLLRIYELIERSEIEPKSQNKYYNGFYNSWPNIHHKKDMMVNKKKFIKPLDVFYINNQWRDKTVQ